MEAPLYDFIILGASGFTGKYVVREALKFLNPSSSSSPLKSFALAGRNPTKLMETLKWAAHPNSPPSIPLLTADISDPQSIHRLCTQTKLILNCAGPFRRYGEPVVAACVETGCDYLDICGEPEFMEKMEANYHERAVDNGCLVISACGFDSVPAELGFIFNSKQWVGESAPNRVEAYLSLESKNKIVANFGTFESAVLGVANADRLVQLRRSRPRRPRPTIPGCPPPKGPTVEHNKETSLWAVRLPSADSTVVRRTLSSLAENPHGLPSVNERVEEIEQRTAFWSSMKPAHFSVKIGHKSLICILQMIAVGMIIGLLSRSSFGTWLLLTFPSIFSLGWFRKNGPSEDEVDSASFKMWFVGHGFSNNNGRENRELDMKIVTRVMGPESGYVATPIILLQCALIVLRKREILPKGGVLTPGIVFGPTDLQKRLEENGICFDVISKHAPLQKW
ncbi:probable mitochondrial saccharopine dehydrogenase-like oxidoreductase At5g39410 [Cucurbita pepo subsp. pepo]|uniref:probable mitochondrial saccharopine dehydrogenase-like oxidoreductase At5g39410 n=1 Tax=Cucurbita pepo subsp. pepo TaxID=3664 RepID=UPI000C9D5580|nr:probable mitochondrial saccharopine dehydrogenase-like oxidoreductase At5g39410 [Cucurbita pepo subsp. pepo]XP_023530247.1 probable mitochondrial saccharopine dehydrogenase-like oxidoreductase At5g39410 [Cucurbita pepo subsp. pepo]